MNKPCVMVVDDDDDIRFAISRILSNCDCHVVETDSIKQAIEQLQSTAIDVVFSDMRYPGELGGEDLLEYIQKNYPHISVVLMSCAMDGKKKADLTAKGAAVCLQKPFFRDTCLTVLDKLIQNEKKAA